MVFRCRNFVFRLMLQSHRVITTGLVTGNCVVIASCAFTLYNHNECEPTSKCGHIKKVP